MTEVASGQGTIRCKGVVERLSENEVTYRLTLTDFNKVSEEWI
jgi:hypothetical protein